MSYRSYPLLAAKELLHQFIREQGYNIDIKLHKQATTTPKIRAEIQTAPSSISDSDLARQYGVAVATIRRRRCRDDVQD